MLKRFQLAAAFVVVFLTACSSFVPPPTPTLSPLEIQGKSVFDTYCARCHSTSSDTVIVGPPMAGIATRGSSRIEGMDAESYIRDSIMNPSAFTAEGYPEGAMPVTLKEDLSKEELEAVIAFLLTLE